MQKQKGSIIMAMSKKCYAAIMSARETTTEIKKLTDEVKATGVKNAYKNLMKIAKEIYSNNGLDMSPLENLLNEIVDEDKIRNSEIDFGIATFSLSEKIISPQTLQSLPVRHTKKPLPDTIQKLSQRFLIFPAPVHDSDTKHRQNDDHTDTVYSAMC